MVLSQNDRLMVGEKSEQKPEVKKHGHKFPKVVKDSFLECSPGRLPIGAFRAFGAQLRR
jgi:hypothetical protein